jgi:hypothetical protein
MKRKTSTRKKEPKPSADFVAVDAIYALARANGWPGQEAFRLAMTMRVSGVTVSEAAMMFADAARRTQ